MVIMHPTFLIPIIGFFFIKLRQEGENMREKLTIHGAGGNFEKAALLCRARPALGALWLGGLVIPLRSIGES